MRIIRLQITSRIHIDCVLASIYVCDRALMIVHVPVLILYTLMMSEPNETQWVRVWGGGGAVREGLIDDEQVANRVSGNDLYLELMGV